MDSSTGGSSERISIQGLKAYATYLQSEAKYRQSFEDFIVQGKTSLSQECRGSFHTHYDALAAEQQLEDLP